MLNNVLFAHDHKFVMGPHGDYFSHGAYPSSFWKRYLSFTKSLLVVARDGGVDNSIAGKFVLSSRESVDFLLIKKIPTLWRVGVYTDKLSKLIESKVLASDVVVARLPSEIGSLAAKYALLHHKRLSVEVVGCAKDAYKFRGDILGKLYSPLAGYRLRRVAYRADAALYVASYLKRLYPVGSKAPNVVCSNVVISDLCSEAALAHRAKNFLDKRKNNEVLKIGLIGSFSTKYKGIDVAIRAISILSQKGFNLELHVLGEGERGYYEELSARLFLTGKVIFHGVVPSGKPVLDWLDGCDLYMQPSYTEGLPRGLLEAMSRGLPAVASSAGGIPDVLPGCFIHTPGDHVKLANDLIELIGSDIYREILRNRDVALRFNFESINGFREQFYSEVFKID